MNGGSVNSQNNSAIIDSLGICRFATGGFGRDNLINMLTAITGIDWTQELFLKAGERIFNLEKMFNYREGFRREDDTLPDRFFEEPLTVGPKKDAVLEKEKFDELLTTYYKTRGWDPKTTRPTKSELESLDLSFTLKP